MPSTIVTFTGTTSPNQVCGQRRIDRCRNGVLWYMGLSDANDRLLFYFSINAGSTWTEDVSQRIEDVRVVSGASMRIITRGDGEERIVCAYIRASDDTVRCSFGIFGSARQAFSWHTKDRLVNTGGGTAGADRRYTEIDGYYVAPNWIVPIVWDRLLDGKARLLFNRLRFSGGSSFGNEDIELHSATSSVHTRAQLGIRHLGDDELVDQSAPDLYVGYNLALGSSGRVYQRRMPVTGQTWESGDFRTAQTGTGIASGMIASCYTGARFATVWSPENATSELKLALMTPQNTAEPTVLEVPDLADGQYTNLGITWDNASSSIYILASGATNDNLSYIVYDWVSREWGTWVNVVTTENLEADTLSVKPGSRGSQIEAVYAIVSGADRQVRYQLVATSNVPPTVTWVTTSGAFSSAANLVPEWDYDDADGDAQSQYTFRRYVDDATVPEYWNGTGWQSTLVNISSAAASVTLSSWATAGDTFRFQVRVSDGVVFSQWSSTLTVVASTIVSPTLTALTTVTTARVEVTWTVAEQSAYRVRLLDNASALVYDSDWLPGSAARSFEVPVDLVNGATYTQALRTQNNEGLSSAEVTDVFTVTLTPPSLATVVLHDNVAAGAIDVVVTNPAPGGGEAAAVRNQIIRRDIVSGEIVIPWGGGDIAVNGTFIDRTVGHGPGRDYGYRARAFTSLDAYRDSVEVTVLT